MISYWTIDEWGRWGCGDFETEVRNIFQKEFGIWKLYSRWVSHLLNADQKQIRKLFFVYIDRFNRSSTHFVGRYVTINEIWVPTRLTNIIQALISSTKTTRKYALMMRNRLPSAARLKEFFFLGSEEVERAIDRYFTAFQILTSGESSEIVKKKIIFKIADFYYSTENFSPYPRNM